MPLENVVSRRYEAESDWIALQKVNDPDSARSVFLSFASTSFEDPTPPGWEFRLLHTHPTLLQRIAMVEAWEARQSLGD